MADESTQQGSNTYNPFIDNPVNGDDLAKSLRIIADALQHNPDILKMGRNVTKESQSKVADDTKWKFQKNTKNRRRSNNPLDEFESGIRDAMLDSLVGGDFKKKMQAALNEFNKQFGVSIKDLPYEMGRQLSKNAFDGIRKSKAGQQLGKELTQSGSNLIKGLLGDTKDGKAASDAISKVFSTFMGSGNSASTEAANVLSSSAATVETSASIVAGASEVTGSALTGLAAGASTVAAIVAPIAVLLLLMEPAIEGGINALVAWGKAFVKTEDIRRKRIENADKRLKADIEYMVKEPFEILKKATQEWYDAWDNNLRKIGQTQGYDKESVYALYESYAAKLKEEGLSSYIPATEIINKLTTVLESGLSGEVAEQFAYIATKLNAAIPTQDFFQYVDSYASIAANAIAQGDSQAEAIAKANAELEQFASNLLYSSRELAGGFSTGLKNSADLFNNAIKISQTAKTYNASEISGTLTSVSAIIGSVAPDLASALVDNVVNAAIGGNDSTIVALRSLAGINAGNTDFLRAMAENPQAIFSELFTNLANMQNMSPDNYMEVAEGLADVFGIDKAAFARVDFNYLAQAISAMNVNNSSLQENLALLASGQTTTSAEQLKYMEIQRAITEEGLQYVLDSEAGRAIQQHMWDEQEANALMENEYAVNLQGAALKALEGVRETITNILNFLNPIGFIATGVENLIAVASEQEGNQQDIAEILELGAIGSNDLALTKLTTIGDDLNLVSSLVEMMGGHSGTNGNGSWVSQYITNTNRKLAVVGDALQMLGGGAGLITGVAKLATGTFGQGGELYNDKYGTDLLNSVTTNAYATAGSNKSLSAASQYSWGVVGKSVVQAIASTPINSNSLIGGVVKSVVSASANSENRTLQNMQAFIDSAVEASKEMGYDAYVATAKNYGISDLSEALTDFGLTEEKLRGYFEANQAKEGAIQEESRKADEQLFRDETRAFWDYAGGSSGIFQTAMWLPFFGDGQKYDTRMDVVDTALSNIQTRIGMTEKHTVIGGIEELSDKLGDASSHTVIGVLEQLRTDISMTFVSTSSVFQRCLADWIRYIDDTKTYTNTLNRSTAWSALQNAEKDQQTEATLALANALNVFSADELKKLDPQLQANALLGEIVVLLQTIMQQNNTSAGSLSLPDTFSALGMGMTIRNST